ncbi:MAG: class I SAM-dependent methyltransferase [Blastocatellia bacterium]
MHSTDNNSELFDCQAASFDQRAGLPVATCRAIARAVIETAQADSDDLIVEVGPGTGSIGQWFDAPLRYAGMDKSGAMLRQFQAQANRPSPCHLLIRADAGQVWPLADGVARVVFSSRTLHLLDAEHIAAEVFRVAAPTGATLIVGRVERERDSLRSRMARAMNDGLRRYGYEGHRGEQRNRLLFEACRRRGGQALEALTVARWKTTATPRQSLDSWRSLKGLGGVAVAAPIREQILAELERWAEDTFSGLDAAFASEERYTLWPLRIPPS